MGGWRYSTNIPDCIRVHKHNIHTHTYVHMVRKFRGEVDHLESTGANNPLILRYRSMQSLGSWLETKAEINRSPQWLSLLVSPASFFATYNNALSAMITTTRPSPFVHPRCVPNNSLPNVRNDIIDFCVILVFFCFFFQFIISSIFLFYFIISQIESNGANSWLH